MRRFIPAIISVVLVVAIVGIGLVASHGELAPKALAEGTQVTINQVKTESSDVYSKIQKNIDMVSELKSKLEAAKAKGETLPLSDVIKDIEVVTKSYESLASQRDDIKKSILTKSSKVTDMIKQVNSEIDRLNARKATYSTKMKDISGSAEIVTTRNKALQKSMSYIDKQIELWRQFNSIEADINAQLSTVQQQLDAFLSVIDSSAIVFREGLNLLQLQQNINDALSIFTVDLPKITQLSAGMESSWDNLDFLVNNLTSLSVITVK
jgi:chromosome segregation ATPase